ncbi:2-hydroxyacyl-CoA lyase 2 [Frankliniella fusca]|uniref:2-hydroxyacyl-CoA lyase 2 n=1 Tax=Frankliniella fusca TaxID=407009 RepID=A0AAE1LBL1_9NEOP|nr:2-hydroxyacyl-CoA lyase 2 [Frankliniella fusca]
MEICCSCFLLGGAGLVVVGLISAFLKFFNLLFIWTHPVDKDSKKHGGEIVADVLKSHGVKFIFTLVGGHISPILVAAEKLGIKVVDTRHEVSAVFAADAVARLSGTIGVAAVTAGPGLTNTITAVKNAQMAESPLLLIGGAAATILKGRGALQDIDQISLFKSICKSCSTVKCVRDIAPTLRKAICTAQSGTPGPVFVEFPIDVLYPFAMVNKEVLGASKPKGLQATAVHWFLSNYVQNIFAGAWDRRDTSPLPLTIPLPTPEDVQRCAELLSRSKKPLLIIGSQATLPPVPAKRLQEAVETLGVPTFLGGMARGLLGTTSKIQFCHQRGNALKQADLVILAGSVCDFRLQYGRSIPRSAKIICVNRNKEQLWKNSDAFWKPTVPVLADVATFIVDLSEKLKGSLSVDKDWLSELSERENAKEKSNAQMSLQPTEQYINPMKFFYELDKLLPDNAILVNDGGDFVATGAYILRPRGPLQWLDPGAFGTLGVGGGFALGAKLCRPDSEVWIIWGDGSCGYSVAEIDTMLRFGVNVISVVGNDAGWTQILREQEPMFKSSVACKLLHTNYHEVSQGYGGEGLLLKFEKDGIAESISKAQKLGKEAPVLLNVIIEKTSFRDGSISV